MVCAAVETTRLHDSNLVLTKTCVIRGSTEKNRSAHNQKPKQPRLGLVEVSGKSLETSASLVSVELQKAARTDDCSQERSTVQH